jgi:2-polyprenyl-3-methyl-5-hydroxy-6-metoxy-1,4-benzoquinol methylase
VLYWSEECAYGRLHPLPTEEELAHFYASVSYEGYLAGKCEYSRVRKKRILRRLIESLVYRIARGVQVAPDTTAKVIHEYVGVSSDICDIGCGSGVLLSGLAVLGHRVFGIEPNKEARELGNQRGIEIVEGAGEDVSRAGDRRFDVVSMVQSLEHARDPLAAVRNCAELLKPGGLLWLEVPNHECMGFAIRGPVWFHTDAGRHIHFFTRASLTKIVELAGLEVVETRYAGYLRQFYWLDAEANVWDALYADRAVLHGAEPPPRPDEWSLLTLAWQTRNASPAAQCDSVIVLARKAAHVVAAN